MRRIAIVTGARAEYGLLYWIIKGIHDDSELELQLIVTGMHLSPEFGLTVREIEKDGFPIAERVEMILSSDTETAIATSMGLGMIGFAKAYERLKPDILVVLGDRFEILSAVAAAVPFRIPVAHIHGGESTEGAMDEIFRHAITKMSHIHFPATKEYAKRIIQMGEDPHKVFCFGSPCMDNIYKLNLMNKKELCSALNIPEDKNLGVVTYHPVTLQKNRVGIEISELLESLMGFHDIFWIITMPNADTGGRIIIEMIEKFASENPKKVKSFASLGQLKYISLLKHSVVMVGNSSSGLIEAPSFELPVVNIGDRQHGRIRAQNVIDVPECTKNSVGDAIKKAVSKEFRGILKGMRSPYGDGPISEQILNKLKTVPDYKYPIKKRFFEV